MVYSLFQLPAESVVLPSPMSKESKDSGTQLTKTHQRSSNLISPTSQTIFPSPRESHGNHMILSPTFLQHLMISDQHYPPDPPEFEWVKSRVQVAKVQWLCRHREEGFYPPCTHRLCAEGLYRPFPDSARKVEGPGWQLEECTHISLNIYLSWVFKIGVQKFGY